MYNGYYAKFLGTIFKPIDNCEEDYYLTFTFSTYNQNT